VRGVALVEQPADDHALLDPALERQVLQAMDLGDDLDHSVLRPRRELLPGRFLGSSDEALELLRGPRPAAQGLSVRVRRNPERWA
jgi:hypothetical protein